MSCFITYMATAGTGMWLPTEILSADPYENGGFVEDSLKHFNAPINIDTTLVNDGDLPSIIEEQVEYDPETNQYIITQTLGNSFYSNPKYLTLEEYLDYQLDQSKMDFWDQKKNNSDVISGTGLLPKLYVGGEMFDRLFGGTAVDIRPAGNIDLIFGGNWQTIDNPILVENLRSNGNFDFDMNINMNMIGQIGEKMKLNFNYNTLATFDFENQVKLEHTGTEDEIIQKLEAGNVSFPLNTLLIPGTQQLFGLKSELKFGRLNVASVVSQQKSQAKSLRIENGSQTSNFDVKADQYEENRHFLLGQEFRNQYNQSLAQLPYINSPIDISRIEVWVTNDQGATLDVRDIVAFMDLGESEPFNPNNASIPQANKYTQNDGNDLYQKLYANPNGRQLDEIGNLLNTSEFDLLEGQDYIITRARKLSPTEFTFNRQLGFISLNLGLQSDQTIAVSYQYTRNDLPNDQNVFQVGEFAQDLPVDPDEPNVLYLKLLKSTTQSPTLPIWDLMMKNVYALGAYQVEREDFRLDVYYQDPGGGEKRYLPTDDNNIDGTAIIRLLNLDKLNSLNDPQPDGIFDFVDGVTINRSNGRLIFPVLEPFGDDMSVQFDNQIEANKFVYQQLYDSTKTVALQFPEKNRFNIKGTYKSRISSDISLGAFNLPPNSVVVKQGGQVLRENVHYTINYSLGRIQVIDDSILQSGVPIDVSYENPELFGFQLKSLIGTRLDYWINDNFTIGGTYMHLSERPFSEKVNYGDDPISNSMYGADINYFTESNAITRFIDRIPGIDTKESSSIALRAEVATFQPGHSKLISKEGQVFIDDFEGSTNGYDLKFPYNSWTLASTPKGAKDQFGNILFDEANLTDSLDYGYNRAKFNWYQVDPVFCRGGSNNPGVSQDACSNNYVREIYEREVFPQTTSDIGTPNLLPTFDLSFYPTERGPYNYTTDGVNADGSLNNPKDRWGGIMRNLDYNDFEASNIEFIEFWVMDPYIDNNTPSGGSLYFNIGEISEDVLKDSKKFFENGLPAPGTMVDLDESNWGNVPLSQQITRAFDNDPAAREAQDVGFDGLNDDQERAKYAEFLNSIQGSVNADVYQQIQNDPSNDNYRYYRDTSFENDPSIPVLDRYKDYNNPHGNSPIQGNTSFSNAATNIPDSEDLNRDNSLNRNESYFEYRVDITPGMTIADHPYITDVQEDTVELANGDLTMSKWYQFKIPIEQYTNRVGAISDFRSIRFIRMFMTDFEEPVTMRFARLELIRNQWRRYRFSLQEPGPILIDDNDEDAYFNVTSVSFEENEQREPIGYVIPPDVERERVIGALATNSLQNEQSMSAQVCGLQDGDARAVFKTIDLDMREFKRIKMFLHAEEALDSSFPVEDGDVSAFIRVGSDFTTNFYEYEIPLVMTQWGATGDSIVWPRANNMNLSLDSLTTVKQNRNFANVPNNQVYTETNPNNGHRVSVVGAPDLGKVRTIMLGVRNPKAINNDGPMMDDGLEKCVEVWFNELSLSEFDESSGYAALATMDIKLADWGNMVLSGNMHTQGYGTLEQKVNDRYKDNYYQYDGALNLELGRFFGEESGIKIPMRADYSRSISSPEFDPYETDVDFKDKVQAFRNDPNYGDAVADEYKKSAEDVDEIKSINFTNVRKIKTNSEKKNQIYDISNWNATYAFTERDSRDPIIEYEKEKTHFASLGYNYSRTPKYVTPFKKIIKTNSKWVKLVKDFNFNPLPNSLTFRSDVNRRFEETKLRNISGDDNLEIDPTFNKDFNWGRFYGFKYDLAKSLSVDYNAGNLGRIDEPFGRIDEQFEKDSIRQNFLNLGRTTNFNQGLTARYKLPFDKLPLTDWIDVKTQYGTNFNWDVGPFATVDSIDLGNVISNTQNYQVNAELKMRTLYNKSKFLKSYDGSGRSKGKSRRPTSSTSKPVNVKNQKDDGKTTSSKDKIIENLKEIIVEAKDNKAVIKATDYFIDADPSKTNKEIKEIKKADVKGAKKAIKTAKLNLKDAREMSPGLRTALGVIVKPVTMVKRVSVNYTEDKGTTLPGFVHSPQYIGQNFDVNAPGLDFIFGRQPGTAWLDDVANKGWITTDTTLNYQFIQNWRQNIQAKASLEPFNDFRIDLNATRTYSKNHSEYFKKVNNQPGSTFEHLSPIDIGSYTISYLPVRTLFKETIDANTVSQTFTQFEANRVEIASRLNMDSPFSNNTFYNPADSTFDDTFFEGYGRYSQDVLLPAFLSAYTDTDASKINLNSFKQIPLPNWRVTYNGLTKLGNIKKVISNLSIKHGYSSTYTVNSFQSNLFFDGNVVEEDFALGSTIDELSGNYQPYYEIPQVVINESFSPLIGVDLNFANGLTTNFDYKKSRNLALSFLDYQLSESRSDEFTIGMGYRLKGLKIPFKIGGKKRDLENDINFTLDVSYRDNITVNYRLDQARSDATQGMKTYRISPKIDYVVNNRLNVSLFYDRNRSIPVTSVSYPITTTKAGVRVTFTLAE